MRHLRENVPVERYINSSLLIKGRGLAALLSFIFLLASGFSKLSGQVTVSLTSGSNPSCLNSNISFTASVNPNTTVGNIDFYNGVTLIGSVALNTGSATLNYAGLPAGPH